MDAVRYLYTARLVPIGKPVRIPCEDGGPCVSTFNDKSFEAERTAKTKPEVWVNHDRDLRIGNVAMLYTHRDWWMCEFMLSREVPADIEFEVGQPVSVGVSQLKIGSRGMFLREVSIVRRGAVEGAQITSRWEIKETPPPAATKRAEPAGEVIYGGGTLIRRNVGQVLAVGGRPLRTKRGERIGYEGSNIVIYRSDGTQLIYSDRAEAIADGVLAR